MRVSVDIPEAWIDALRFAARDLGASQATASDAIRCLIEASPVVRAASERAGVDLPDMPAAKWGGKRDTAGRPKKSEHADDSPKTPAAPAIEATTPVQRQSQRPPAPATWTGKTVPKPPAAHATTPRRGAAEDYEE